MHGDAVLAPKHCVSVVRAAAAISFSCVCALQPAFAARPFVTDDARIVDPGGYQIESYVKHQRNFREDEAWFLPAMNPGGNIEYTLGGMRADSAADGLASAIVAQAKTLLRPLRTNDFGLAATLGALRQQPYGPDPARWSPYLNLITSVSRFDDAIVIHANAGALDDRVAHITRPNWGLGAEIRLQERLYGIVETYGQHGDKPNRQLGLRYWVAPNRVQIDGTLGDQRSAAPEHRWLSLGLRLLF